MNMRNRPDSRSAPPTIQRIASTIRITGWIGFYSQLVLAIVSSLILLFAAVVPSRNPNANPNNLGAGSGLFFAVCGLLALYFSVYWAFRYTRVARQLRSADVDLRSKKADVIQVLQIGLIANLAGMLLTIVGAEATIGGLLARALTQFQGAALLDPGRVVEPIDIFVVQANINTIAAQFVGIAVSLWLLKRVQP